jgi:hypothetical protein
LHGVIADLSRQVVFRSFSREEDARVISNLGAHVLPDRALPIATTLRPFASIGFGLDDVVSERIGGEHVALLKPPDLEELARWLAEAKDAGPTLDT